MKEDVIVGIILIIAVVLAFVFGFSGAQTEWIIIGIMALVAIIIEASKKKKG